MLHSAVISFNPLGTNCSVLWNEGARGCVVADPGMASPEEYNRLKELFEKNSLTLEAIILTHGHFDHTWGVESLLKQYPVPVYMHPADRFLLPKGLAKLDFPTLDIADGDALTLAGISWKVIHTPGHTPGSVCWWSQADSLLLSGDTLFAGSIGRTDLEGGDYEKLMSSIKEKLLCLPGETDVIPGHGGATSIAREGMYNPFLEPFNEPPCEDE